ncbi:non-hydrolyzing UDP-N-acetylglucosamine 2-epimerase [Sphingomonas nostoxanthinifaciens]|uniref:non-hydrolyzing UDP-N-acetylglucosamine 2-epimerase n=1 Tax=Sphingomonas nostoxanthinifaciens TaxID=2872652 RepID=UPI0021D9947A|nr:UDP-N-acetylglucosamine 2-epimerase (non-hydrolyzing) [Sphingomonas nostoxanthinifaciens]
MLLILAARADQDFIFSFIHTGQHGAMFDDALRPFGIVVDEALHLRLQGLSPDEQADRIHGALPALLTSIDPDMVLVQGDTTSAWAAAHIAHDMGIPLGHIEAGLRSGDPDLPWPEERNRRAIDKIADLLLAPSEGAAANLREEGVGGHIVVTGNTGIDALMYMSGRVPARLEEDGIQRIVVTCHRRENWGAPATRIASAVRTLVDGRYDRRATVVLHDNPNAADPLRDALADSDNVELIRSVAYPEMVARLKSASLVLSDSGGLQEECAALGVPLLVLRSNTERPEVIASGNALLVGSGTREIVDAAERLLSDAAAHAAMSIPAFPYGRGEAARRILDALLFFPFPRMRDMPA